MFDVISIAISGGSLVVVAVGVVVAVVAARTAKRQLMLAQDTHWQTQDALDKIRRRSEKIETTVTDLKRDVDSRITRIVDRFIDTTGQSGDRWRR